MTPKNKLLTSLLAGAALLSSQASAQILFSDDFSNNAGSGGTGWETASAWSAGTISGGQIAVSTTSGAIVSDRNLATPISVTGADFWFVANFTYTGTRAVDETFFGLRFLNGTSNDNFIGANTSRTDWYFNQNGNNVDTSPAAAVTSSLAQVVMHFTETQLDMWVNPADTSSAAALGSAHATYAPGTGTISGFTEWTGIRLQAGHGSGNSAPNPTSEITATNMIAATTFAEAIPEPSTGLLAVFATAALFLRRRRA